jgi:hypothetical protein
VAIALLAAGLVCTFLAALKGLTMNTTFAAIAGSAVRHGLTLAGGYLVAKGVISDGQSAEFVGLGMAVVAFGWSWLQKHNAGKALGAALRGLNR